jgi:hypothetical protein
MQLFVHGSGRPRHELDKFKPTFAQQFLYARRNASEEVLSRELHQRQGQEVRR